MRTANAQYNVAAPRLFANRVAARAGRCSSVSCALLDPAHPISRWTSVRPRIEPIKAPITLKPCARIGIGSSLSGSNRDP